MLQLRFAVPLWICGFPLTRSRMVFSEIMLDPLNATAPSQWFEVYNTKNTTVSMNQWRFLACSADLGGLCDEFTFVTTPPIGPLGHAIIGNNANPATNWGVSVDLRLSFTLFPKDGAGNYITLFDQTAQFQDDGRWSTGTSDPSYDAYIFVPGASLAKIDVLASGPEGRAASNWKASTAFIDCVSGDKGTPRKANSYICPYKLPTKAPTKRPTKAPSKSPTPAPVTPPSKLSPAPATTVKPPTKPPTKAPAKLPSKPPTKLPSKPPTKLPSKPPFEMPLVTKTPNRAPTNADALVTLRPIVATRSPATPSRTPVTSVSTPVDTPSQRPTKVPTKTSPQSPMALLSKAPNAPFQAPNQTPLQAPSQADRLPTLGTKDPTHARSTGRPVVAPIRAPTAATTPWPVTATPIVVPTKPMRKRCGLLQLSLLCWNGCGLVGRLLKICKK